MKKIYIYLTFVCLSTILAGCDKFLDIKPTGSVIPTTLDEYRALWVSTCNNLPSDRGLAAMGADEMHVTNSGDRDKYSPIERWETNTSSTSTTSFNWAGYYQTLYYANYLIEHHEEITEGKAEEIRQLAGEAYLMRAYMHFVLVNLHGQPYTKPGAPETKAVPLKLDTDMEKVLSRNTVSEVYAAILSDLEKAEEYLNVTKWSDKTLSYRFTTLCVPALRSRIYLYMGNWEEAYTNAEKVLEIQGKLEDFNAKSYKLPNHFESVEAINAMEYTFTNDYSLAVSVLPSFLKLYEPGDLRIKAYFSDADDNGNRKCLKGGSSTFRSTIRTGEIYLNSAEAAARAQKLPEARKRLLELMSRRYTSEAFNKKKAMIEQMTQENLISEIMNERARELAFEGHRWFDLRRTSRPKIEKTIEGEKYVLEQDDARYTILIPKEAIAANPNLNN